MDYGERKRLSGSMGSTRSGPKFAVHGTGEAFMYMGFSSLSPSLLKPLAEN